MLSLFFVPRDPGHMPRVSAIPVNVGRDVLEYWVGVARTNEDNEAVRELAHSLALYDFPHPESMRGAIALHYLGEVHALALLERVEETVHIRSINADDSKSGTLLLQAMRKSPQTVLLSPTVHPRWQVASWFLDS